MSFLSKNPNSVRRRLHFSPRQKFPTRKETFTSHHHNPKLQACVNPPQLLPQLIFLSKSRLTKMCSGWEEGLSAHRHPTAAGCDIYPNHREFQWFSWWRIPVAKDTACNQQEKLLQLLRCFTQDQPLSHVL